MNYLLHRDNKEPVLMRPATVPPDARAMATIRGTVTGRPSGEPAACTVHVLSSDDAPDRWVSHKLRYGSDRQRQEVRELFRRGRDDFFAGL